MSPTPGNPAFESVPALATSVMQADEYIASMFMIWACFSRGLSWDMQCLSTQRYLYPSSLVARIASQIVADTLETESAWMEVPQT